MPPSKSFDEELLPADREQLSVDDVNLKVQQAEEVLLDLERRREQIERQKRQLEEIRRKQYEFEEGQRQVLERLKRGLVLLTQQEYELKRESEDVSVLRASFADHLHQLEAIRPQTWDPADLEQELTQALAIVDQAKGAYSQAQMRLENASVQHHADVHGGHSGGGEPLSAFWAKVGSGFAYSLPLLIGLFLLGLFVRILFK